MSGRLKYVLWHIPEILNSLRDEMKTHLVPTTVDNYQDKICITTLGPTYNDFGQTEHLATVRFLCIEIIDCDVEQLGYNEQLHWKKTRRILGRYNDRLVSTHSNCKLFSGDKGEGYSWVVKTLKVPSSGQLFIFGGWGYSWVGKTQSSVQFFISAGKERGKGGGG